MGSRSFCEFPEDVQLCILSFLSPSDVAAFACTSRHLASICGNDGRVWLSMCDRKWGSKTQVLKWRKGKITYKRLYDILSEYETLIGFWRLSGGGGGDENLAVNSPPLVFFEWGPSFVAGSRVLPSTNGTYQVVKTPFLWMSTSTDGGPVNFLNRECHLELSDHFGNSGEVGFSESELISVNVSFVGKANVLVEENMNYWHSNLVEGGEPGLPRVSSSGTVMGEECRAADDLIEAQCGLPDRLPDPLMSEVYQFFARRKTAGGERTTRKQGRSKWVPEHLTKVVECSPTPGRPLQGLWKGICDGMNLGFHLVEYDEIGGILCRRIGDTSKAFSTCFPVFWTLNADFVEPPFSPEEQNLFNKLMHLQPLAAPYCAPTRRYWALNETVTHILYINSSYDLVMRDMVGTSANARHVEGRIWLYRDGTFGLGFLRDNYIIDLKPITQLGCLLDTMELNSD